VADTLLDPDSEFTPEELAALSVSEPPAGAPVEAATDPLAPDEAAPFGYMLDADTGERRAKKRPGRQARAAEPAAEAEPAARPVIQREKDVAPRAVKPPRRSRSERKAAAAEDEPAVPMPRVGVIAKGVNKLYVKAGKLIRVIDPQVGAAVIAITRKDADDDVTVGEAWEELAKANPRIRAVLLRLITGGAWGQLLMCHLPILLAVLMRDGIRERIPFMDLAASFLGDEDEDPYAADDDAADEPDLGGMLQGLTQEDLQRAMAFAQQMTGQVGVRLPSGSRGE
jgi:hypothetical protein